MTIEIGSRQGDRLEGTLPLWLQTEIVYSDADRTILDELRKCAHASSRRAWTYLKRRNLNNSIPGWNI